MPTKDQVNEAIDACLDSATKIAAGAQNASSAGAARDNAETVERFATAAVTLIGLRERF
jgi:hypothetical protein